jgi:hypothetical protein
LDHLRLFEELIGRCDLSTEAGKKAAYGTCAEYAMENLRQRRVFNAFMEVVAERLGVPPVRLNSFRDTVGDPPENAKVRVDVCKDNLVDVAGNAEGLRYLASLMLELAREPVEDDHIHLHAGNHPMCGKVYLDIYHEFDAWFESLKEEGNEPG